MDTLQYGISFQYVKQWTWRTGLRELLQNWLDAGGAEHGRMDYDGTIEMLTLSNPGTLTKKTLLLGESEKPDGAIGQFGEGYKLGALALLRDEKNLSIASDDVVFRASTYEFEGEHCLEFQIFDGENTLEDEVRVMVHPITPAEMEQVQSLVNPEPLYETEKGNVLEEKALYLGGLYVKELDAAQYHYGYDLPPKHIRVNRDREMVNEFDFHYQLGRVWAAMSQIHSNITYDLIAAQSVEVKYLETFLYGKRLDDMAERMMQSGLALVENQAMAKKAQDLGYTPMINSHIGELTTRWIEERYSKSRTDGQILQPTEKQCEQLHRIEQIVFLLMNTEIRLLLKEFENPDIHGECRQTEDGTHVEIYVKPGRFAEMLESAIHETIHANTQLDDYTKGFQTALEHAMTRLIEYYESR